MDPWLGHVPATATKSPHSIGRSIATGSVIVLGYVALVFGLEWGGLEIFDYALHTSVVTDGLTIAVQWAWFVSVLWGAIGVVVSADTAVRSRMFALLTALLGVIVWVVMQAIWTVSILGDWESQRYMHSPLRTAMAIASAAVLGLIVAAWVVGHRRNLAGLVVAPIVAGATYWVGTVWGSFETTDMGNLEIATRATIYFTLPAVAIGVVACWVAVGIDKLAAPQQPRH